MYSSIRHLISVSLAFTLILETLPAATVPGLASGHSQLAMGLSSQTAGLFTDQALAEQNFSGPKPMLSFVSFWTQMKSSSLLPEFMKTDYAQAMDFNPEWLDSPLIKASIQAAVHVYGDRKLSNDPQTPIVLHRARVASIYEDLCKKIPGIHESPELIAAAFLLQTEDNERLGKLRGLKKEKEAQLAKMIHRANVIRRIAYNPAASTYRADRPPAERRNILNHMEQLVRSSDLDGLLLAIADKLATMEHTRPEIRGYLQREIHEILAPLCSRMGQPELADFIDDRAFFLGDRNRSIRVEKRSRKPRTCDPSKECSTSKSCAKTWRTFCIKTVSPMHAWSAA